MINIDTYNIVNKITKNKNLNLDKHNIIIFIKMIAISLYALMNMVLFLTFIFSFTLIYIKELSFGCFFDFKLYSFIYSILCSWINLILLSPIILIPNIIIFYFTNLLLNKKNKLFF